METGIILNHTYQVLHPIGIGGLGEIYLGYHLNLQKYVVIKKVKGHCTGLLNNRIEADILKSLHHTYLPQVYDFIQMDDSIFTVMDYISGHDLKYYLEAGYCFPEEQVVLWMEQLCQVLDYLHSREPAIIHCDIKPGNIMITEEGNVCLIDFNISLDGENNKDLVGLSSQYASPEQMKKAEYKLRYGSGDQVKMDARTDLFSLGAVFYYVMTGIRPDVRAGNVIPLRDLDHPYSDSLANIVDKAMEPELSKRFRSAARMLSALEHKEIWSREYRWLLRAGAAADLAAGCLAVVLICTMILGYQGMKRDDFFQAYDRYIESVEAWGGTQSQEEAQTLAGDGIRILNQSDYKKQFEKYTREKANVLYGVGQAFLAQEDYRQADRYLEEALKYDDENPGICRDLAIVQARRGKTDRAAVFMEGAVENGLAPEDGALLQAEIAMENEDYETAWQFALEAAGSGDQVMAMRAAGLLVEAEEQLGNTEECIRFLQQMADQSEGVRKNLWLRKEGELCIKAAAEGGSGGLTQAAGCYETIRESGYAQLTDLYNLAAVYSDLGRTGEEKELLLDMAEDYPDEYEIYLRLAYVSYRIQNSTSIKIRDYSVVQKYYREACRICGEQGVSPQDDVTMLQMEEILSQLREQGQMPD